MPGISLESEVVYAYFTWLEVRPCSLFLRNTDTSLLNLSFNLNTWTMIFVMDCECIAYLLLGEL